MLLLLLQVLLALQRVLLLHREYLLLPRVLSRDLLRRDVEEAQRAQRPSQCNAESRRICYATEHRVGERGERIDCGAQNTTEQEEHSDQRA